LGRLRELYYHLGIPQRAVAVVRPQTPKALSRRSTQALPTG
jgi:hypothetical protein